MKQLVLFLALLTSAIGFSKTGENDLRNNFNDSEIIELITSQINIHEFNNPVFQSEIVDIQFDEYFPCTLTATVTGKVIIDGMVAAEVTMSATLDPVKSKNP